MTKGPVSYTHLDVYKRQDVVVADNLVTGHIEAVDSRAKFYKGDIRDINFLDDLFSKEKIDAVIHFAAYSLVGESVTDPLKYYDNNLCGTKVLLESCLLYTSRCV